MREIEGLLFIGFITFFILTVIWLVRRDAKTSTQTKKAKNHE